MSERPDRLIGVAGTGTEVGKTWVTAAVAATLVGRGWRISARKPAQSFEEGDPHTDAVVLAAATGEDPAEVCPPHRSYPVPMAPPMAAAVLGRRAPSLAEAVSELGWRAADIGFVETVGGVRSPLATDGDSGDLLRVLQVDATLLVADAELGVIHDVRACVAALREPVIVFLNRFDPSVDLHRRNLDWLVHVDGLDVAVTVDALADRLTS